jgi:hypothetical protein
VPIKSEMKKLFLDDVRSITDVYDNDKDFIIVKNYEEFISWINSNGLPDFISFDHDLADEHYNIGIDLYIEDKPLDYSLYKEKTGMECAKWLINYCLDNNLKLPDFKVHSANPAGRDNILSILTNFKKFQENEEA